LKDNIVLYNQVKQQVETLGFNVVSFDFDRPWGGFLVIDEQQLPLFISTFFDKIKINTSNHIKLSPKVLIVNPKSRLSWQYHNRRAEIWQVYKGQVGVVQSNDDIEKELKNYIPGDQIRLNQGARHRLVGLADYGVVAEMWQHTDEIPSNEDDIIRVQDDFNR